MEALVPGRSPRDAWPTLSLTPSLLGLIFLCSLISYGLMLMNPGLYWDDWVWIFHSNQERIQSSRELGNFWGGYVGNALYALKQSALVMRAMAFLTWLAAACACAGSLGQVLKLPRIDVLFVALLFALFPIANIRYINSLTFYNIYIASFWLGTALTLSCLSSPTKAKKILAICLFFFSFYLNSIILVYGLLVLYILYEDFKSYRLRLKETDDFHSITDMGLHICGRRLDYLILPFIFVGLKKILSVQSTFYGNYNTITTANAISGLEYLPTFFPKLFLGITKQFLALGLPAQLVVFAVTVAGLIFGICRRPLKAKRYRGPAAKTFLLGLCLCAMAIIPYLFVGKIPTMSDFYESRHYILTPPGLGLVAIGLINLVTRRSTNCAAVCKYGAIAFLIAIATTMNISFCLGLWNDNFRQQAIFKDIAENIPIYNSASTIVFNENIPRSIYMHRKIWGYEYTGYLIGIIKDKTHLGISPKELTGICGVKDSLFGQKNYRRRYNLDNYDIDGGQLEVNIREVKKRAPFNAIETLKMIYYYYFSKELYTTRLTKRYTFSFHKSSYCQ